MKNRSTQKKSSKSWWSNGIQFQCQGSGNCCVSRGEYGFVYLTLQDRKMMARHFNLTTAEFSKIHCKKTEGIWHLKEEPNRIECGFLKNNRCSIYHARPTQCRTWPFWPEHMSPKKWKKEVADFCPGVGKGKIISAAEISENLEIQKISEALY